jgi:hypothetical protein
MDLRRPVETAVRLLRAATEAQAGQHDRMSGQVRRALDGMTSRGERELFVGYLALLGASMARRVPDEEREAVFAELRALARLGPEGTDLLHELARFGMVA